MNCDTCKNYEPREKPEHYDGEEFGGEIFSRDRDRLPNGCKLVFVGNKKRKGKQGEWGISNVSGKAVYYGNIIEAIEDHWILRPVPIEPQTQYKVGDWVYVFDGNSGLSRIKRINSETNRICIETLHGSVDSIIDINARPAVPADFVGKWFMGEISDNKHCEPVYVYATEIQDGMIKAENTHGSKFSSYIYHLHPLRESNWTVEVCGVKCRANELKDSISSGYEINFDIDWYRFMDEKKSLGLEICKRLGIPIRRNNV